MTVTVLASLDTGEWGSTRMHDAPPDEYHASPQGQVAGEATGAAGEPSGAM